MKLCQHFGKKVFVGAMLSLYCTTSVFAAGKGSISGSNINVRSQPSKEAQVLGRLTTDDAVVVEAATGDWVKIQYDGGKAYISQQYVKVSQVEALVKAETVNYRSLPNDASEVLGQAKKGDKVVAYQKVGNWYEVGYNGKTAYIFHNYLESELLPLLPAMDSSQAEAISIYAIVASDTGLNLRGSKSTEATVVKVLSQGEIMDVLESGNEWVKVQTEDGQTGYVSAEFISVRKGVKPSRGASSQGQEIVDYAKQFIGTRYSYGGTNLNSGVDCSGFVFSVYKHFGINLNRSSKDMINNGTKVAKSELQVGDLVFFDTSNKGRINHVGIYIGNSQFIHSSSGKAKGVTISGLNEGFYLNTYRSACRVLR